MHQLLKTLPIAAAISLVLPMIAHAQVVKFEEQSQATKVEVKLASEIPWRKLNPARGDASPQAGTIWGDQTKDGASGFLVKFVDGFSSPPHIHNITYRAIVLAGAVHNDDPEAEPMWMKPGSYWQTKLHLDGGKDVKTLKPGGYFGSQGKASHQVTCKDACTIYVRSLRTAQFE